MLHEEASFDKEAFKLEFKKRFSKFCKRSPIMMSFTLHDDAVDIFHHKGNEKKLVIQQLFVYADGVKDTIHAIKEYLCKKVYPVFVEQVTTEVKKDSKEISQMLEKGEITLDNIGANGVFLSNNIEWRPERILINFDEMFMRNLNNNIMHRYKTKMPVTFLLKKLREFDDSVTEEEKWKFLRSKLSYLGKVKEILKEDQEVYVDFSKGLG